MERYRHDTILLSMGIVDIFFSIHIMNSMFKTIRATVHFFSFFKAYFYYGYSWTSLDRMEESC